MEITDEKLIQETGHSPGHLQCFCGFGCDGADQHYYANSNDAKHGTIQYAGPELIGQSCESA